MSDNFIGFRSLDLIISNKDFLEWYNSIYKSDSPYYIWDFEFPNNGESAADVIVKYICDYFHLSDYAANISLEERDNVEFPQRTRFLAKFMLSFETEKEFNRYKISDAKLYTELVKIYENPILVNPDYGSC